MRDAPSTPIVPAGALHDLETGRTLPVDDLNDRVDDRAKVLAGLGVQAGHVVALLHETSFDIFVDLFAVWRLGAVACVLDPSLSAPERANIERFVRPVLVIASGSDEVRDNPRVMPSGDPQAPVLILTTSGTTGAPKGVVLTRAALSTRIALNRTAIGDTALERTLLTLPLHFGHGLIGSALTPLCAGGTLILPPRGLALATRLGPIVDESRVTFFSSVPTFWRLVLRTSRPPSLGTLQRVHVGSAPLSADLWSAIAAWTGAETVNCFGITETANWVAGWPSSQGIADGRVGRAWGGELAVRDAAGDIQPSGEGEVMVRSDCLMQSYLDRPDLTHAVLKDGWYATGDSGEIDADGVLTLRGRMRDEINRAGQKIHPADVETVLEAHPGVAEACVFAVPDPVTGEAVGAVVVVETDMPQDPAELASWCRERLRPGAVPQRWFFLDAVPRTARGKVSRSQVQKAVLGDRLV